MSNSKLVVRAAMVGGNGKIKAISATPKPESVQDKMLRFALGFIEAHKGQYKGVHTVWSGYNDGFESVFEGYDAKTETQRMVAEGKLASAPRRGGVIIYPPADAPSNTHDKAKRAAEVTKFWHG